MHMRTFATTVCAVAWLACVLPSAAQGVLPAAAQGVLPAAARCSVSTTTPGEDRRGDKTRLVIATFNVWFLFDGVGGDLAPPSPAAAENHVQKLAVQIRRLGADLLALQEVESCAMLDRLLALLNASPSMGYRALLVPGRDSGTRQNVALLTRIDPRSPGVQRAAQEVYLDYPIAASTCAYTEAARSGVSKYLLATFDIKKADGTAWQTLTLANLHLKAGGSERDCAQREAQAQALAQMIERYRPAGAELVVLGDFNARSAAFEDSRSRKATGSALASLAAPLNLTSVARSLPQAQRYTASSGLLDHILLSPRLASAVQGVRVDHAQMDQLGLGTSGQRTAAGYSDHFPLVATLDTDTSPGASVQVAWSGLAVAAGMCWAAWRHTSLI